MARWFGKVGYSETVETDPGIWESQDTVREYYGDVLKNTTRWSRNPDSANDNLTVTTQISIVADDDFAIEKFHSIKWIEFMGEKWGVDSIDPTQPPRLILTLGGVYNG